MSDKSTFHESWYKVSELLLRVHVSLKISRQNYRNKIWYIIRDPGNNNFFRVNTAAYQFIAYLDGRRTVDKAWGLCYEEFGDNAPTQGEAISLLGQLYSSNLLQGDVPADTDNLLKRHQKRRSRERTAYMKGILFAKIPVWDPDHFLDRWAFLTAPIFSRIGYIIGFITIAAGATFVFNNIEELAGESQGMISLSNIPLLYLVFAVTKLLHEFGHGFACKYYGQKNGTGGNVNTMGIAFLLMTPVPYVDATSSWAFKNKWQRIAVAGAGMYIELILASIAAILWTATPEGHIVHSLSFNLMLVSSVTTILFNGNPLLRYDAYYMLSDFFEIPNLAGRSKLQVKYIFRKYLFGVKKAVSSAYDFAESILMVFYASLAELYKLFICISIILIASEISPILGLIGVALYLFSLILTPLFKLVKYLFLAPELQRTRNRASIIMFFIVLLIVYLVGIIRINDRVIVDGVIEPKNLTKVFIQADGFTNSLVNDQKKVEKDKTVLFSGNNPELLVELEKAQAEIERLDILIRAYTGIDPAKKSIHQNMKNALLKKVTLLQNEKDALTVLAPSSGVFIPTHENNLTGRFVNKGSELGMILSEQDLIIRSIIDQETIRILNDAYETALFRLKCEPGKDYSALIESRNQVGMQNLPSAALGYLGGGEIEVKSSESGTETKEFFFDVVLKPTEFSHNYKPGQIVSVRFEMKKKTVFEMVRNYVNRLLLKRFRI
ncbi:MAG: hypothetical protein NE328_03225 [Lentisphaeraceae bacterium]|nr:hypothetical protein [Lentisphaeraceae bacterium]